MEPTMSQQPGNAVVKLGEYLMCHSRLCEPRILFAAIVVSIYVEPTTSQQPANVVVKLGEYLICQSRLCEPRRTRVSFTA